MTPILGIIASGISSSKAITGSFESIATVSVGSGGSSSISFSSIPSTYTHLQLRAIARTDRATSVDTLFVKINSDSSNYYTHGIYGTGATAAAYSDNSNPTYFSVAAGSSTNSNVFSAAIWDLLDYADVNKYKTIRVLHGLDDNGSGTMRITSSLWTSTSAISSLTIQGTSSQNLVQFSHFALYGIKS